MSDQARYITGVTLPVDAGFLEQVIAVAGNPAAQTAFGPMVLVALEQNEPPGRRLVDDDLAARFLPAPTRWLVTAPPPTLIRRLAMSAFEREGPGLWASMTCRKRFIADKLFESLNDIDAVVILGAGFDTLPYRGQKDPPIRDVPAGRPNPFNIARKTAAVRRALGSPPRIGSVGAVEL